MNLRNKRILITAGPTWVPIDNVRVISNIATGRTGILLAEKLHRLGAKVTLLLGTVEACCLSNKIKLVRFKFFDELYKIIKRELKTKQYDIVIHGAAVSDYKPRISYRHKVKSGKKIWRLNLSPTPKIIEEIKKIDRSLFLVGFKFGTNVTKKVILDKTKLLIKRSKLDLAVANSIYKNQYKAYIVNNEISGPFLNKKSLAQNLVKVITKSF